MDKTKLTDAWLETSTDLLKEAQANFKTMQQGWWIFAKSIHDIKKSKAYEVAGHSTFREYCEKEFPAISYTTLFKFVAIIEYWQGTIENKMAKDKDFILPAYETCYSISAISPETLSKSEVEKLKKAVIESNMTYSEVRAKIHNLSSKPAAAEDMGALDLLCLMADNLSAKLDKIRAPKKKTISLKKLISALENLKEKCEAFISSADL